MTALIVLFVLAMLSSPGWAQVLSDGDATVVDVPGEEIHDEAWYVGLLEDRGQRDQQYRLSPTSPFAGVQYLKSRAGAANLYLHRDGNAFRLEEEEGSEAVLQVLRKEGAWHWHDRGQGVVCRAQGEESESGAVLSGPALFSVGSLTLSFYPTEDQVTFIVFDPDRPEKKAFEHLHYYSPSSRYLVEARLERLAKAAEVTMLTSRNLEKTFFRYALIHFRLDDGDHRLTAYKYELEGPDSNLLFIPFRDLTSGDETYGAGRFLILDEPQDDGFSLDFNRAFNPLCNYSPAFNCAIPPRENHLQVAIRAGEKTYPMDH
jgi:uncharacterized protein (DUF1684 family)